MMLNNRQKRYLKALAHARKPVVIVGGSGLTPAVLAELKTALDCHELIKVRVKAETRDDRALLIDRIRSALQAELVQQIGHIATLFRRNPAEPRIQLP